MDSFNELEKKINGLIAEYMILKDKNREMEDTLRKKEEDIKELNDKIFKINEERNTVRIKIDDLLRKLENFDSIKIEAS